VPVWPSWLLGEARRRVAIDAAARADARSQPFGLIARVAAPDVPTATHLAHAAEQGDSDAIAIIEGPARVRDRPRQCVRDPRAAPRRHRWRSYGEAWRGRERLSAAAASLRWNRGDVVRSDLGDDGGMIGAAIHALDGR
jgi:hypothetical protein